MDIKMNDKQKEMLMTIIEENINQKKSKKLVKKYDFKSPQKFSKEHVRSLEKIFTNFSRNISNYLSAQLGKNVKVSVDKINQISYQQYINELPSLTALSLYKVEPFNSSIMIDISPVFAYKILEMLLGGRGGNQNLPKEFSDIDKKIIITIMSGMCSYLESSWKEYIELNASYETLQTNVLGNQVLPSNEPVALIKLLVRYDKEESEINICIPYIAIEGNLDKLITDKLYGGKKGKVDKKEEIKEIMRPVDVNVKAELGTAKLSLEEFLKLNNGDIIVLNEKITEPSTIYIEDIPCFYAKTGTLGRKSGVQILDVILKEE